MTRAKRTEDQQPRVPSDGTIDKGVEMNPLHAAVAHEMRLERLEAAHRWRLVRQARAERKEQRRLDAQLLLRTSPSPAA